MLLQLRRRGARCLSTRAAEAPGRPGSVAAAAQKRNLLPFRQRPPGKKKAGKALQVPPSVGTRVSVHMMGSIHDAAELAETLRGRFPSGAVQRLNSPATPGLDELWRADSAADDSLHDVVHLTVPAAGESSAPNAPLASVLFFAGVSQELGACGPTCVSVWWGADPAFEQALLTDLRALHQLAKTPLGKAQQLARLAIPREEIFCQEGERTELGVTPARPARNRDAPARLPRAPTDLPLNMSRAARRHPARGARGRGGAGGAAARRARPVAGAPAARDAG